MILRKSIKSKWLALLCVLTMFLSILPVGVAPVAAAETNDTMGPVLKSVEVTPKTVEPSGKITVTIDALDPSGISWISGVFKNSLNGDLLNISPEYNTSTGMWEAIIYLPGSATGEYNLDKLNLKDNEGNISYYTASDFPNATFTVGAINADLTPPQVLEAAITPSLAKVGDTITLSVYAVDEGVGVGEVSAYFFSPSGYQLLTFYSSYDEATDRWVAENEIANYMEAGTYTLAELYVADTLDNYQIFSQSDFPNLTFEVDEPDLDLTGPVVKSIEVSPKVVEAGGTVTVTIDAYDASGIASFDGTFSQGWNSLYITPDFNDQTGKWEATLTVPTNAAGEYYLSGLYLDDNFGNQTYYYASDFPSATFTVGEAETTLKLTPAQQEVKPGDTFTVNVDVENVVDLYGAEAKIGFDSTKLAVVDADLIKDGTQVDVNGVAGGLTVRNEVYNGEIWFSVARQGDVDPTGFTGNGTIATITFRALEEAKDLTYLDFMMSELSDAGDPPQGIPHYTEGAEVKILSNGSIDGYVRLQGLYSNEGAVVSLLGTGITTETDTSGYFKLEEVPAGHHTLVVSSPERKSVFLTQGIPVDVDYNQNTNLEQIVLLTGDVNSDNKIGLLDLSKMAAAYDSYEGDANWDRNADLNDSYHVELFDLVLMAKNWKQVGYEVPTTPINPTATLTGFVWDEDSWPYALLQGAFVTVADSDQPDVIIASTYTDATGYFSFENISLNDANGQYIDQFTVTASKPGYTTVSKDYSLLQADETRSTSIYLSLE